MGLEYFNHLVELLISPIRAQLADAPLNGGLAAVWCLYGLRRQQRPRLTDVVENVGHLSGGACEGHCWRYWC